MRREILGKFPLTTGVLKMRIMRAIIIWFMFNCGELHNTKLPISTIFA